MPTFDVSKLEVRPIKPNPGGQIDPGDHIGHGDEYELLKTATATGKGALLTGDRRMGKTSMFNVIEADLKNQGHQVIRVSAETEHFETFATRLRSRVRSQTVFGKELDAWSLDLDVEKYGIHLRRDSSKKSTEVDEFWEWAVRRAHPARLYVLLDEITVLAHHMQRADDGGGLELLRSLKRARDLSGGPVMVFAGSIGLHHALSDFSVVAGLARIAIGPLKRPDAMYLAQCLILGAELDVDDEAGVATAMVAQTDGMAYYLHHLANSARLHSGTVTAEVISQLTTDAITSADDPWELRHYDDRVDRYFGENADAVRWILDSLATATKVPTIDELRNEINTQQFGAKLDRDDIARVLDRIERDHYIVRDGSTGRFASELLRRAWLHIRRL